MHSPQAIDLNTLQMGTGLCSFSQAHSLLKERARFFGRRPRLRQLRSILECTSREIAHSFC